MIEAHTAIQDIIVTYIKMNVKPFCHLIYISIDMIMYVVVADYVEIQH